MAKKSYELELVPVSSKWFHYDPIANELFAEASTLAANGIKLQPLFNDAADVGLAVRSEKTGKVVRFAFSNPVVDDEGELQAEVFRPYDVDVRHESRFARTLKLVVVND